MKKISALVLLVFMNISHASINPIMDAVVNNGGTPSEESQKWMKKWKNLDLESDQYFLNEISGTTSINLKVKKSDPTDEKGYKNIGSFVTLNESANPNAEIAYYNLSLILGVDSFFRPAIPYWLKDRAKNEFKALLLKTEVKGAIRNKNKASILNELNKSNELFGCMKAKKIDLNDEVEDMVKESFFHKLSLKSSHLVVKAIQANEALPKKGTLIDIRRDYRGDLFDLSREFSVILTLDAVFGQYDRLTGGNINVMKDEAGMAHFYASDNGGAEIVDSMEATKMTLKLFNRFDKNVILKLKDLYNFLTSKEENLFLGYSDKKVFIKDLGMMTRYNQDKYLKDLTVNLGLLLKHVDETERRYGDKAFFVD